MLHRRDAIVKALLTVAGLTALFAAYSFGQHIERQRDMYQMLMSDPPPELDNRID